MGNLLEHQFNGIPVNYQHKKATSDKRHLVVIMSGFRKRSTFDFDGASITGLKCDILWIEDWFDNNHTYYIRGAQGFEFSDAIHDLIETKRIELGLSKDDCTIAGFSKGGSGALYHTLKFDYMNMVIAAPRMNIGSSTKKRHPEVFHNMTVNGTDEEAEALDQLIPNLLSENSHKNINIYLFSSPKDYQYTSEIVPFLPLFNEYENFNYVETHSKLVTEHIDVTWYNAPVIVAILITLAEGLRPKFGAVQNGGEKYIGLGDPPTISTVAARKEPLVGFDHLYFHDGLLFPEGYAFIKGESADTYRSVERYLILKSDQNVFRYRMGGVSRTRISAKFFENEFCDYSTATFASLKFAGINIDNMVDGNYKVGITLAHGDFRGDLWNIPAPVRINEFFHKGKFMRLDGGPSGAVLSRRSPLSRTSLDGHFEVEKSSLNETFLHLEGHFVVRGQQTPSWSNVNYYLVLQDIAEENNLKVIPLSKDWTKMAGRLVDDPWGDYSKCYFTTPKYGGVNIDNTPPGIYRIFVTASFNGNLFSNTVGKYLSFVGGTSSPTYSDSL